MITATLTSKGQLTLPKAVRDLLHLVAGDRVGFEVHDNGEVVLQPVTKSVDEVFGRLHRPGRAPQSVAQMKAAVAAKMKGRK